MPVIEGHDGSRPVPFGQDHVRSVRDAHVLVGIPLDDGASLDELLDIDRRQVPGTAGQFPPAEPAAAWSSDQRGAILSRPNPAPSGSLTIANRPPGKSCGESISFAPRSSAFRYAASTSSTVK
jgi:hypothetical protein